MTLHLRDRKGSRACIALFWRSTLEFSGRVAVRWNDPLCSQFNKFSLTAGRGYWLTVFDQSLNVKFHRFMDEPCNFGTGFTHSYATGACDVSKSSEGAQSGAHCECDSSRRRHEGVLCEA